ncbi:hypothetical protein RRSWK_07123 [Rhodopirellula sp. SWK7]|nr:hypothetical protein RRSWK_07123 [Rhodopirellula sp. SWK7]
MTIAPRQNRVNGITNSRFLNEEVAGHFGNDANSRPPATLPKT